MESSTPESPVQSGSPPSSPSLEKCLLRHFCWVTEFYWTLRQTQVVGSQGSSLPLLYLDFLLFQSHSVKSYFIFIIKGVATWVNFRAEDCPPLQRKQEGSGRASSIPLGQGGSGEPGPETQQNPWQPFMAKRRASERVPAERACSRQPALCSGGRHSGWGVLSSHPRSAASLGHLSSLSPAKNEGATWEKRRGGVLKVGTTWQCTSHGCTEASRELSQVSESKHSHREWPLDFPIHDSKPSQRPSPLPSVATPHLPMPLTFRPSYLKSFDFAQDVVLWHCLNCLLTFCSPIRDKNTVMGKCPGSHRIVEGPGMQIMCFILLGW